jgi:single-stranded-DNA-specific exonuclease
VSFTIREVDEGVVQRFISALKVHPITARCLAARGLSDTDAARSYLDPRLAGLRPPEGLAGLDAAVDRLVVAVRGGERVGCFGDYDVDGVTTCALITSYLRAIGQEVIPRVARREAGYGFGVADVHHFVAAGCRLVITGDCGTSDERSIELARSMGIEVIVIDHHTVPSDRASGAHPALALVNPLRRDSSFPFRGMASVGLAFYTMAALRTRLRELGVIGKARPDPDLRRELDLVAIGTLADQVPLAAENRILASHGLRLLARQPRPGLIALLTRAGQSANTAKSASRVNLDERSVAWKIAPRLNAPGRLGDASPALELLLAESAVSAQGLAAELELANQERRRQQEHVMTEALAAVEARDPGPCALIAGAGWSAGVVGIVAARLAERLRRPAFVVAIDPATGEGRGSGRSFAGVDLCRLLTHCGPLLTRYGGHAAAAGLTVPHDHIDRIRERLWEAMADQGKEGDDRAGTAVHGDAEVALGQVDEGLTRELSTLAPFGRGNEEPLLITRRIRVRRSRVVGDGRHLKLEVEDGHGAVRAAIAFGMADRDPGEGATIDAAFAPAINEWNGRREVELGIRELSPR